MNNTFLQNILKLAKNENTTEKSYQSIVQNLFIDNKHGVQKAMGLDEYSSEENSKYTMFPGHIYSFMYLAENSTKYTDGTIKFEYFDTLPIIICTNYTKNIIKGFNLNLCNYGLRALILNDIYSIDPEFFEHEASDMAHNGQLAVSKKIYQYFMQNESDYIHKIVDRYKLKNINLIYRTYSSAKMKNIRYIEPWQWQYIPFINYKQSVKESTLKLIHNITGIEKIKI